MATRFRWFTGPDFFCEFDGFILSNPLCYRYPTVTLFNSYEFLGLAKTYRSLSVTGRFGSGKTAIAWYISKLLLEEGFCQHIVCNFPALGQSYPPPAPLKNSVLLLDEAGTFIRSGAMADTYYAALRKNNNILISPTVVSPPRQMGLFSVQRVFNFYKFGLPLWFYKWKLRDENNPLTGYLYWFRPISDFANGYDTVYFPTDDWGIQDALIGTVAKGRKFQEQKTIRDYQ